MNLLSKRCGVCGLDISSKRREAKFCSRACAYAAPKSTTFKAAAAERARRLNARRRGAESVRAELAASECGGGLGVLPVEHSADERSEEGAQPARVATIGRPAGRGPSRRRTGSAESGLDGDTDGLSDRMDPAGRSIAALLDSARWPAPRGAAQYPWEPPRVTTEKEWRRKRLKALGNAVVSYQVAPLFIAIREAAWRA